MTTAIVLFAHGARDPEWANPVRRVQHAITEQLPGTSVEVAFLEFMAPTLPETVQQLLAKGVRRIVILPMFIAQGGHLKRELPEMVAALRDAHPGLDLVLCSAIGEHRDVVRAMAGAALEMAGLPLA